MSLKRLVGLFSRFRQYNGVISRGFSVTVPKKAKLFVEAENEHVFGLLNNQRLWQDFEVRGAVKPVQTLQEFEALLSKPYRTSNASQIVEVFNGVKNYCIEHNIDISDKRFDGLVDGLMDHCQDLTDDELYNLLKLLAEMPVCQSYTAHNLHDVWSCLDDVCLWKMKDWDMDKMLNFANLWYKLHLGKLSDFTYKVIDAAIHRADNLTKDQLVHIFFLLSISRRHKVTFQLEYALEKQIKDLTINDMSIVSLGYFKTHSSIKLTPIIAAMIEKVTNESRNIHEITLTAIMKAIRLATPGRLEKEILTMLDKLTDEVDRLSNLSALHIALIGTSINAFHRKSLQKVSEKFVKDISNVQKIRLKEIERLLHALTMFDFDPKTNPDVFQTCLRSLQEEDRELEYALYPRCLPCALQSLSLRNIYCPPLMDKILRLEFIEESYGKGARNVPRDIFFLDRSIEIECPDYKGHKLPPELRHKVAKWLTDYTPSHDQYKKITKNDELILNTIDCCAEIAGGHDFIHVNHILPHYSKADIILCKDLSVNKFVPPEGLQHYTLGDIMAPPIAPNVKWYSIIPVAWNNTIRSSTLPVGQIIAKQRQLRKIGYEPILIIWNEFMLLKHQQKIDYIHQKL